MLQSWSTGAMVSRLSTVDCQLWIVLTCIMHPASCFFKLLHFPVEREEALESQKYMPGRDG